MTKMSDRIKKAFRREPDVYGLTSKLPFKKYLNRTVEAVIYDDPKYIENLMAMEGVKFTAEVERLLEEQLSSYRNSRYNKRVEKTDVWNGLFDNPYHGDELDEMPF